MISRTIHFLPAVLLLACSLSVAQEANPTAQLAQMGGAMHAAAQVCGDYTDTQLQDMKNKQKEAMKDMGLSEADFDVAFEQGLQRGRKDLEGATNTQRNQMCEQLRSGPKF
ncbi:hypothetical protein ACDW82_11075 [Alcaligenes faecalis]|uniref:Uncharacterized protein n=2 Tax=Alcaligenes TaxID=507 RepID=A0AB33CSL1_ALCFA|nr:MULTISPECIES: hypothetical protein [Alcaligenes]ARP52883.1 lipoprotein [Alcaligenes faecalis]ASR88799.1 hypothetical protein AFA_04655 [Alcaligenes faecalis]MBH0311400.1 hypothetical protein [Alcaligenes faecalis]MCR4144755.1 hypothetical protein [Alcaligenes faecalis]MCX5566115.1 hypothetical protein [Alcaligenes phenolicus]